ncbi:MAG: glucose-6-phosphate dehydrogenase [Pseudomonadota bacterium]
MVSRVIPVAPFDLVIFGGTGDLARRKILPGLFRRFLSGQMPGDARIIGCARSDQTDESYRAKVSDALKEFAPDVISDKAMVDAFLALLHYVSIDARGDGGWNTLKGLVREGTTQAFYFSVAPGLFGNLAERLHTYEIAGPNSRIVVEKPFGRDLETARALNATLAQHFDESQIYRIDHYLGKETVQNLMAIRFGNILFEPLWNAQYVDHVQITVAESVGVEGRGEYYDKSGAMRDMVQNHMMQLLCLTAMEAPSKFDPDAVRDEKLKVIRALEPISADEIVRGQYSGTSDRNGYLEDAGDPNSRTESYVAMKLHVANWRWNGTPFYLRTGKCLRGRMSEIVVSFKEPPHSIFGSENLGRPNELSIRLQPNEGIDLRVTIKEPGPGGFRLVDVPLDMTFADALGPEVSEVHDAYERLVMDVIRGNQTLFMRGDEVEAAWAWTDPIIEGWQDRRDRPQAYDIGSSGPEDAMMLMHRDGRRWREIRA